MEFVDNLFIALQCRALRLKWRAQEAFKRFEDESGVSSFVATILLIVIVVALTAIFWEKISAWFTEMWIKITGQSSTIGQPAGGGD